MKKILLLIMALSLVFTLGTVTAFAEETTQYVAEMNGKQYETLAEAVAEVAPNTPTTIELIKESATDNIIEGKGVVVNSNQIITFDFNDCTYKVNELVGSSGTETIAMQLLENANVILKNGKLTSQVAKMLVQNYSDLTIDNLTLDGNSLDLDRNAYTLSNNSGTVLIKGSSNIYAKEGNNALDLWYGFLGSYNSGVSVRFDDSFNGEVIGNIEYGAANAYDNWTERTNLVIDGNGVFKGSILPSSKNFDMADANITILGGTFTSDVSSFMKNAENLVKTADGYKVCYHNDTTNTVEYSEGKAVSTVVCIDCNKTWKTEITHTHTFIETETAVAPTCESLGYKTYVCECGAGKTDITPATGHKFTSYKSNGDATCQKNATETAKCDGCDATDTREIAESTVGHKFTVYTSDNNAECEKDGTKTAVCDYGCGNKDTVTDTGSALDHDWNEATYSYSWSKNDDNEWVCTAERKCQRTDCSYSENATATITSKVTTAATCETKGKTTYTATFTEDWATAQTKVVTDVKALGHSWNTPTYTFAADGSACTATRTCKRNADHKETAKATITSKVTTAATCETKGKTTYTATFTEDWATAQTKVVADVKALGHDYEGVVTKKATCIAEGVKTYTCKNDKSHTKTEKIAIDKNAHSWSKTGPECTLCKLEDEIVKVTKAYYNITSYNAGDKWSADATVTFEATFKNHSAKVTFTVSIPSGLDMDKAGNYVAAYTYKGLTPENRPTFTIYPANTTSFTASAQTSTTVTLKWAAAKGASGYRVFYKAPGDTKWRTINDTTALSYKVRGLKAVTKYTFAVRPFYDTGSEKLFSEDYPTIATLTCTATPELTKVTASSSTKGKAYVYHTDVAGETGYTVYYSTSSTTGFKKYNNFKADTTSATITGLTSGKTYYFKVRTFIKTDSGYVYSPWSAIKSVKVK